MVKLMQKPTPQTIRGRLTWYFLKNLPGLLFILALLAIALIIGQIISDKRARLAEELKAVNVKEMVVNVVTLQLKPTVLRDTINLPGLIEAWIRLDMAAMVSGKIEEVFVEEGEHVKKGQVIARIETKDYRIALDSARAAYSLARANFARDKILHGTKVVPRAALDARHAALIMAKAAMEDARLNLSRCQLSAPMDGIINRLDAKVGLFVNIADPVAEILAIDRVKAVVGIPESAVTAVKRLREVELVISALDNKIITAPVHFLAHSTHSLAYVYRLELSMDNPAKRILPGMFIRANIVKDINEEAIAVPLYSVISEDNVHFVYVYEKGVARKRQVEPGFIDGWMVLITSGLKAGENIIIKGHRVVEDGQAVKVVKSVSNLTGLRP